ncbi:hypothetical protein [Flavobacterium tegetincola]|uniref:hypothetical protein n=1 Tax=Flavobacterium tegetincola TaxID=150172 RepID=UPI0012F8D2EF|nr:hypothetical protein [Flavobacterium tegetincola]
MELQHYFSVKLTINSSLNKLNFLHLKIEVAAVVEVDSCTFVVQIIRSITEYIAILQKH